MIEIENISVGLDDTLKETIEIINKGKIQLAIVNDSEGKFVGVINDGDIRRYFLNNVEISTKVKDLVKKDAKILYVGYSSEDVLRVFNKYKIKQIPILDENEKVVDLKIIEDYIEYYETKSNKVIIMVGGLGSRLYPLTKDKPKPMLEVGDKPILETIIANCSKFGLRDIILSINYKAELIQEYFGDGSKFGVSITYILEDKRMGTAGALTLIDPNKLNEPFVVMNGDLLTKINLDSFLKYHIQNKSLATMGVREYDFKVPYGVINISDKKIVSIDEKPVQNFFINAGIYVMNPQVIDFIPYNEYFDMNQLFEKLLASSELILNYPITEYWMDIGQFKDYEQANIDFGKFF